MPELIIIFHGKNGYCFERGSIIYLEPVQNLALSGFFAMIFRQTKKRELRVFEEYTQRALTPK
jgi:hypothetical protein